VALADIGPVGLDRLRLLDQRGEEGIGDRAVDIEPLDRLAGLAVGGDAGALVAAVTGSAEGSTIIGSLPPSSRLAGMKAAAAASATLRPVATEPVKQT
jgi:hypothetical protein